MKTYFGKQSENIDIFVKENGKIRKLTHIVRHSPTGFQFGYGGSGPADTALSILTDCIGRDVANAFYQKFKFEFVAGWKDSFEITAKEIRDWLKPELSERNCNE